MDGDDAKGRDPAQARGWARLDAIQDAALALGVEAGSFDISMTAVAARADARI
ncbi:MAG: hypothetical protein AAGM38_16160 [Pseudomonadota bacterium]